MAELLAAALSVSVSPPGGSAAITMAASVTPEQHGESMRRRIKVPAASTDFAIPLPDLATVAMIVLAGNRAFSYRIGLVGNTLRTCRKFAVETPNNEVIPNIFITTTTFEVEIDLLVVGD